MQVHAIHLGKRIGAKGFQSKYKLKLVSSEPHVFWLGRSKYFVVFKYGMVVSWNLSASVVDDLLSKVSPFVDLKLDEPIKENFEIKKLKGGYSVTGGIKVEKIDDSVIKLVSLVLAKSVVLDFYEKQTDNILFRYGQIIDSFAKRGKTKLSSKELLKSVGSAMKIQNEALSQMAMLDKPDFTWEDSVLDDLYLKLDKEYEISERYAILTKKLRALMSDGDFILNYIDTRWSMIMEISIIFLILVEVALFVYEIWFK